MDGFKKPILYYTDTDSLYIASEYIDILKNAGLVGNQLGQGKNDYDNDGVIIYGLFLAPKVKYCITLDKNYMLAEHKTFKGYTKDKITVEEFLKLEAGKTIENNAQSPWIKSFEHGIEIPDKTIIKKYNVNTNILKRQAPDENNIMYPYFTNETEKVYNNIKLQYGLTDEEMFTNYFDLDYTIVE